MKSCVFCHELILDKGHKISSLYTFDKKEFAVAPVMSYISSQVNIFRQL